MYLPKHFAMTDDAAIAVLQRAGVAQLVTLSPSAIMASTLPLLFVPGGSGGLGSLHGHVARANRQWVDSVPGSEALVLFAESDAYVSPSAYATKRESGKVVPTWNYVSVQVRGSLVIHDDAQWTRSLVDRLTTRHEANHVIGREANPVTGHAWSTHDAPADYINAMVRAIVGIEIVITAIEGKAKLSQNRSTEDVSGVIADLRAGAPAEQAAAAQMEAVLSSETADTCEPAESK
jgi:transcriptional regulator